MKLAIIGSGNVGKALAASAVRAGHDVTLTASSPEHATDAAQKTGAKAAASNTEAANGADIVILAIPAASAAAVVSELGAALEGKTVVDVTNRVNPGDPGSVLDGDSVTEQIMVLVPRANFVKAFNTNFATALANPTVDGVPADAFIAGDNAGAKASVGELAGSMGFRPLDVGSVAIARVLEGMALVNILLQMTNSWPWQSSWKLIGPTGNA
jgi:8-hydroxy-5-deazaflavin:NADPH oxidoreductase